MLLLIDNYDSFSYNLYQMIGEMCPDIRVIRNDAMSVEQIRDLSPSGIILSPGPGRPVDAGVCEDVVKTLSADIPILGVCLGEQAIVEAFGGVVTYAKHLMHGKQSKTKLDLTCHVFRGLPEVTEVARYHSLAAEEKSLPEVLNITARADDGEIMAVAHRQYPVFGLQFHPESIMTPEGKAMLKNFLDITA